MADIYDRFDAATAGYTASAIFKGGQYVGKVILVRKRAVTAYVQTFGFTMASGRATGGGYDRGTAAVEGAAACILEDMKARMAGDPNWAEAWPHAFDFVEALKPRDTGATWESRLRDAGFTVAGVL